VYSVTVYDNVTKEGPRHVLSEGLGRALAGQPFLVTLMPHGEENDRQVDDNDLKTANLVNEQETKAIKADVARLEKALDEERKHNEEYLASLRYLQADFENYRKRVDKEIRELEEFSTLGLVRKLIPVLDDLDLAVTSATKAEDRGLLEGVKMVQKSLSSALEARRWRARGSRGSRRSGSRSTPRPTRRSTRSRVRTTPRTRG
jgi:hypothetical protein